jgi:PPOX class probable F420-dependent enzyme
MTELPEGAQRIIDGPNLAHFVTLMPDGSPQVTPVWVDHDGEHVLINTALGRQKALNLRRDPRVALSVVDREDTQHYVQVRGRVVEFIEGDQAWEHISKMSQKYRGHPNYPRQGAERLLLKIAPRHVTFRG